MNNQTINTETTIKKSLPDVVIQAFDGYSSNAEATLLAVRELIFTVQKSDQEIGELQEVLRWGELSFLTEKPNTGSIIRLALTKSGEPAVFFHCGTTLVETFRAQYSHIFDFEGNRAIVLQMPVDETIAEISHCIKQALRYKLDARSQNTPLQQPLLA